ncbi:hypothetical protein GCM10009838_27880 [Catenulispora subtropica]|uniref:Uncharacterized protein n=1 Tax=Catenulispora subtropica TaxID=450798 RepID=A0ABP5CS57_9ACTN
MNDERRSLPHFRALRLQRLRDRLGPAVDRREPHLYVLTNRFDWRFRCAPSRFVIRRTVTMAHPRTRKRLAITTAGPMTGVGKLQVQTAD